MERCLLTKEDLTNNKYGKLTVTSLNEEKSSNKKAYWNCVCECTGTKVCRSDGLKNGTYTHCGCVKPSYYKHGMTNTRLFNIWGGMKDRCCNKKSRDFPKYGGRGIFICNEWLDDFMNFYNWAMANGYADDLTIDRIDNDGIYEPSNCRWVDVKTQQNNTSFNNKITLDGVTKSISEWSEISGVSRPTIRKRYNEGLSKEEILKPNENISEFKSGVKNIRWDKSKASWRVECRFNKKTYFVCYTNDLQYAIHKQKEFYEYLNNAVIPVDKHKE